MRIKCLKMVNYRQFFAENSLEFSTDSLKNITVIHGENGAGKTSILNAFKWVFFGSTDFETKTENLINEKAIALASNGSELSVEIEVKFEHDSVDYECKRIQIFQKLSELKTEHMGGSVFTMSLKGEDGISKTIDNPVQYIQQILPERMHPYFFFNGERLEKLSFSVSEDEIRNAIKNLMGLEVMERAIVHLDDAVKHFRNEEKKNSNKEKTALIDKEIKLGEEEEELNEKIVTCDKNINAFKEDIKGIDFKLESCEEVRDLQQKRSDLESEVEIISNRMGAINKVRKVMISQNGGLAFSKSFISSAANLLEKKREKGELPYKVKPQFLTDLMELGKCICGTPLSENSIALEEILRFKSIEQNPGIEEEYNRISGDLKSIEKSRVSLLEDLNKFKSEEFESDKKLKKKQGILESISEKLKESGVNLDKDTEDVATLEKRRNENLEGVGRSKNERSNAELRIEAICQESLVLKQEIKKLEALSKEETLAKQRKEASEESLRFCKKQLEMVSKKVKDKLSEKVGETFKSIIRKNYWAEISDTYTLEVKKKVGNQVQTVFEKSTGESQVTSLCFIGSIINLAKERYEQNEEYFKGGLYPIVMDSPFGSLDEAYREDVARLIPQLADQVILLASTSQWKGPVQENSLQRMGKEYSLIYHKPDAKESDLSNLIRKSEKYEYTTIEENNHA